MRRPVKKLASFVILAVAGAALAGCGQKKTEAPEANLSTVDAAATALENGTVSDITATDATIGYGGGVAPANEAPETGDTGGNGAAADSLAGNSG